MPREGGRVGNSIDRVNVHLREANEHPRIPPSHDNAVNLRFDAVSAGVRPSEPAGIPRCSAIFPGVPRVGTTAAVLPVDIATSPSPRVVGRVSPAEPGKLPGPEGGILAIRRKTVHDGFGKDAVPTLRRVPALVCVPPTTRFLPVPPTIMFR